MQLLQLLRGPAYASGAMCKFAGDNRINGGRGSTTLMRLLNADGGRVSLAR